MAENDDDPFAGIFGLTADDVAEIESQADEPVDPPAKAQRRGRWFVFDLETIPDETRFPKPERPTSRSGSRARSISTSCRGRRWRASPGDCIS